jgi:hypothetical protein
MTTQATGIDATFEHKDYGYRFAARYKSKRSFLAAFAKSKHKFICAVDFDRMHCIHAHSMDEYRAMK